MSKQAGWTRREENAFIRTEKQRTVVAIARSGLGRKIVEIDGEKLRKSRPKLAAGQGVGATYKAIRYGT
jgi:hypothetical protein